MIKKVLRLLVVLVVTGGGIAAGMILQPEAKDHETSSAGAGPCGDDPNAPKTAKAKDKPPIEPKPIDPDSPDAIAFDYVKMHNQFVIPVIRGTSVSSMVVVALSLEVASGSSDDVYAVEPRLRDHFLQVFFDHAASGGFDGAFVNNHNLLLLRRRLLEKGAQTLGARLNDVLITDITRQDM